MKETELIKLSEKINTQLQIINPIGFVIHENKNIIMINIETTDMSNIGNYLTSDNFKFEATAKWKVDNKFYLITSSSEGWKSSCDSEVKFQDIQWDTPEPEDLDIYQIICDVMVAIATDARGCLEYVDFGETSVEFNLY